ncbi:MAG: trypsin-like peptidase domain-containing protein [Clostridia bacterium]|nr:trypsin-like peptidase domain-containing protein [Clostridia bacterium]
MADFIYNNFNEPNGDDNNNNNDWYYGYDAPTVQRTQRSNTNLAVILVCAFFGILILLTFIFGSIIVGKLTSSNIGNQNVDSMIFSTPKTELSTPVNPSATTPRDEAKEYESYSEVIYAVKDSVVEIKTQVISNGHTISESAGSGVIIGSYKIDDVDAGYYVVTNAHVVEASNGIVSDKIMIKTTDGKEYEVTGVRGSDTYGDIAVLMINTTDKLKGVSFGDSNSLVLGQEVIAIGNPLGELGGSCTNGIISALDREVEIDGTSFKLLQTNAAINQGNSGGGLFNMKGQLVGIINAKTIGDGVEGIGFAIPSNEAKNIVSDIIEFGYAKGRPFLGITIASTTDMFSKPYVYIHDLESGYNDNVLQKQDIILSLNGTDITTLEDFRSVISKAKPGDSLEAVIKRGNEYITISLMVYEKVS